MEALANSGVEEIPGSVALIKYLKEHGYPLAVASASNFNYVSSVLSTLGVVDLFETIVSGDMVQKGKPDPESFLLAAEKIKVSPSSCVVIEDGKSGMEAAKRAGMKCVGLVRNLKATYPTSNLVRDLKEISTEYLERL
jgi:HAD superfamily hydrolase (TIGR01509 family)